jgi:hypothetical protein
MYGFATPIWAPEYEQWHRKNAASGASERKITPPPGRARTNHHGLPGSMRIQGRARPDCRRRRSIPQKNAHPDQHGAGKEQGFHATHCERS